MSELSREQVRVAMLALLASQDDTRNARFIADVLGISEEEAVTVTEFEYAGVRFTAHLVVHGVWMNWAWTAD